MSFVKLDQEHQEMADDLYESERKILFSIDSMSSWLLPSSARWVAIGKTDIEKGFMALRKAVTLSNIEKSDYLKEGKND
jgi:hypothetical protein